jgi:hypothetical protein
MCRSPVRFLGLYVASLFFARELAWTKIQNRGHVSGIPGAVLSRNVTTIERLGCGFQLHGMKLPLYFSILNPISYSGTQDSAFGSQNVSILPMAGVAMIQAATAKIVR